MIKAIIFDFDGVIAESVEVKTEAFRKLFSEHPKQIEDIVKVHMDNGGMSRYKKFDIIFRDILKKELTKEENKLLGDKFTEFCYQGVIDAKYVKGAREFLEKYYRKLLIFVATGTPHEEMLSIVRARGEEKYYKGVYGSPQMKKDIINNILRENNLKKEEIIFIGDSINDFDAANETQVCFVGRVHDNYPDPFDGKNIFVSVKNIKELEKSLVGKGLI